jgi:hypothetical protein
MWWEFLGVSKVPSQSGTSVTTRPTMQRHIWILSNRILRIYILAVDVRRPRTHTQLFYVCWTVHHLGSWIKRDQLDVTWFIISLFTAQHVSNVSTSILRSLRLICWVISWVVLHIEPEQYNPWNNSTNKSQAHEDGCTNIRNMLSIK